VGNWDRFSLVMLSKRVNSLENYWASYKNAFVHWFISFPKELIKNNPEILIHFTEQFCLMCAVYGIAQLERISNPIATWKRSDGKAYPEHLKDVYETTGNIPFFYHNINRETPREDYFMIAKSKICFYGKDALHEDSVSDLSLLLNEFSSHLNIDERQKIRNAPVSISGYLVIPDKIDLSKQLQVNPFLFISLYSDIWLPFVFGSGDNWSLNLKSNEVLAKCHTPRFNQWLRIVKSLAIDWGATWTFETEGFPKYQPMLSEDGINLNYRPT
jgi:hypothetical protein